MATTESGKPPLTRRPAPGESHDAAGDGFRTPELRRAYLGAGLGDAANTTY
jgi:hypothetical protein